MKDIPIAFIDDDGTTYESENFVDFKVKEKDKEIERLKLIIENIYQYNSENDLLEANDYIEQLEKMSIDELKSVLR